MSKQTFTSYYTSNEIKIYLNKNRLQARTTQYIEQPRPLASRKGGQYDTHEYGFKSGYCFGFTFLLLFLCLFCLEVARVFTGSVNRKSDGNYQLYPSNIYLPPMFNSNSSYNVERQNHYLWLVRFFHFCLIKLRISGLLFYFLVV